jgi:phosphoribosylaminoimidazole-succinocarboxamide synthase
MSLRPPDSRGKVRDLYDLGDALLIVASDRISAFDVVFDDPVPDKGRVLTAMSRYWLDRLPACRPHHVRYYIEGDQVPKGFEAAADDLAGRSMVVEKARVLPIECVVRGYLVGGGWSEYVQTGRVSGISLPDNMRLAERLPEPIFTPSTKATTGHDEPVSFERSLDLAAAWADSPERGRAWMLEARERALAIYSQAADHAWQRGIVLADTKFEFGVAGGRLILVDEVLTPDSSRFWPADEYQIGTNPPSFDKQYLRDYLEQIGWNKSPPAPRLPAEVVAQTRARYVQAYERLCGASWPRRD